MTLKKGHNSTNGDNPDFKTYVSIIYYEESIYESSKLYLNKFWTDERTNGRIDRRTDVQAQSNIPL